MSHSCSLFPLPFVPLWKTINAMSPEAAMMLEADHCYKDGGYERCNSNGSPQNRGKDKSLANKCHFLIRALASTIVFWFAVSSFGSLQSLPAGWWQTSSPKELLTTSLSITGDLTYFRGTKAHLLNEPSDSIEFFERKTLDGTIETKRVWHRGRLTATNYKIKSGRYIWQNGRLVKAEFEDDQKELSLAAAINHPYDYKMLKSELIGTNDCLVVARIASPQLLQMLTTAYYPGYTAGKPYGELGDPTRFIMSEIDTYIRTSDGISIGALKRNKSDEILDDRLYDVVEFNNPIPDAEFVLPKAPVRSASNTAQLLHITFEGMHRNNSLNSQTTMPVRFVILGAMTVSSGALLALLYFKFHRKNIGSNEEPNR
jgi:hypothetical protein